MVPVESDVSYAGRRYQPKNSLYHTESCAENWDKRQLFSADMPSRCLLQRSLHFPWLETQLTCCLVSHEHRDLVDQLLEHLGLSLLIAQDGQLVLDERMPDNNQRGEFLYSLDHFRPTISVPVL
jgi:hypothetical protein